MSRPSSIDARYQRYAGIFEDPETAQSIERGWRVLHHEFMENFQESTGRLEVGQRARKAQELAEQRRQRGRSR